MSLLQTLFDVVETNGASGTKLIAPVSKSFSFDLDSLTKEHNTYSSVLWNFGDPISPTNEIVAPSITKSLVYHEFTYAGNYTIHSIANVNGVVYHGTQFVTI